MVSRYGNLWVGIVIPAFGCLPFTSDLPAEIQVFNQDLLDYRIIALNGGNKAIQQIEKKST